ncbi:hypothetical protein D3C81_1832260 [compost metagenome]
MARADAPASRMGPQPSFTLDEPPVTITPSSRAALATVHCASAFKRPWSSGWKGRLSLSMATLPKILSFGACISLTLASGTSSSSATSIGKAVCTPCPISLRGMARVTVPSVPMASQPLRATAPS